MRGRSPKSDGRSRAASGGGLAAAVLTACGPQDTGADDKGKALGRVRHHREPGHHHGGTPGHDHRAAVQTTNGPAGHLHKPPASRPPTAPTTTKAPTTPAIVPAVMAVGDSRLPVRELQARLGQPDCSSHRPGLRHRHGEGRRGVPGRRGLPCDRAGRRHHLAAAAEG